MTRPATPDGYVWRALATDPPTEADLPVLVRYKNGDRGSYWSRTPFVKHGITHWAPLVVPADPPRTVTITIDVDLDDWRNRWMQEPGTFNTPAIADLVAIIRDALDGEAET